LLVLAVLAGTSLIVEAVIGKLCGEGGEAKEGRDGGGKRAQISSNHAALQATTADEIGSSLHRLRLWHGWSP